MLGRIRIDVSHILLDNWTNPQNGMSIWRFLHPYAHLLAVHLARQGEPATALGHCLARENERLSLWRKISGDDGGTLSKCHPARGWGSGILATHVSHARLYLWRFFTYPQSGPLWTQSVPWKRTQRTHVHTNDKGRLRTRRYTEHREMSKNKWFMSTDKNSLTRMYCCKLSKLHMMKLWFPDI